MSAKESSDELNPPTASDAVLVSPRTPRTAKDYLALAIATCGVGYLPLAPGTWGSLVGVGLFLLMRDFFIWLLAYLYGSQQWDMLQDLYGIVTLEIVTICGVTLIGIWAASRTEKLYGIKDPGKVVIDEVAGQMIALLPVPLVFGSTWWYSILAFILFRFFDIVKPYPARRLESLEAGLGIMADDIVAGVYAAIAVALAVVTSWFM
ncbi:MAG: phosphatidylglycerophosphatase A [bacterium]